MAIASRLMKPRAVRFTKLNGQVSWKTSYAAQEIITENVDLSLEEIEVEVDVWLADAES